MERIPPESPFPAGLFVFFRVLDGHDLARSIHPDARQVALRLGDSHPDDYMILDGSGRLLGIYPREFVSAILPISTVGPGNANNSEDGSSDRETPAPRNTTRLS